MYIELYFILNFRVAMQNISQILIKNPNTIHTKLLQIILYSIPQFTLSKRNVELSKGNHANTN